MEVAEACFYNYFRCIEQKVYPSHLWSLGVISVSPIFLCYTIFLQKLDLNNQSAI